MRDVLTEGEIYRLASMKPVDVRTMLQAAARLGAERAMQPFRAPDGDLPEMLTKLSRLRGWYEIGPAQRAEVDTLVEWVKMRAQERAARVCDRLRGPIEIYNPSTFTTLRVPKPSGAARRGDATD